MSDVELVKFSATWCRPCERYAPIFNEFVEESGIESQSFDIDENTAEASRYEVSGVPTTILRDKNTGETLKTATGALSKPALRKFVALD